jgi:DNA-binding GntR family transcriptional regulator
MKISSNKFKKLKFRPTVLAEEISRTLTEAIMEGVFKGGDQLVESELQEQLGISRSPIREALRDLEKKGLVEIVPRKGTFVKTITRRDIEEHFPVRATLEGLAAKMAYRRMNAEDLRELREALANMEKAVERKDAKAYWEHHHLFHEIFINASGNGLLIDILKILRMHALWYRFSYQYYKEDFKKSLAIHHEIMALFANERADERKIEETVRQHIEVAVDRFLEYLEEHERQQDPLQSE